MRRLIAMVISCFVLFAGMNLMAEKKACSGKKKSEASTKVEKKGCGCKASKCAKKGKQKGKGSCKKSCKKDGKESPGCKSGGCKKKDEVKKKCCGTCKKAETKEIPKGMEKGSEEAQEQKKESGNAWWKFW